MRDDNNGDYTWHPILDEMDKKGISIMKFRSSRGKPRIDLVEYVPLFVQSSLIQGHYAHLLL
jgi:hypothetical protein